jgi:hypothetical protein
VSKRSAETNFMPEDGWHDDDHEDWIEEIRFEVALRPMTLYRDLQLPRSSPYFISFDTADGQDASVALHQDLSAAGISGFISARLETGQWREDIVGALRRARTVFLVETVGFHARPRCRVERDFAIANGARIVRLGLCSRGELHGAPSWISDFSHVPVLSNGAFDLSRAATLSLPDSPSVELRKRAGIELLDRCSQDMVTKLASKLQLADHLAGSLTQQRSALVEASFGAETRAERFCTELDLMAMF